MISYIRHNSVFDLGSRSGSSTCVGLYKELDDIYSKYINPQVRVQYATEASTMDCLCNMSGKQTLSGGSHAFVFQNGTISVTVDESDNVTVADSGSGGGGGDYVVFLHNYNTGELQYRSTIELAEIDETKKVDFYIADVDEFTDDIPWGFAMACPASTTASYGGNVNLIYITAGSSTLMVESVSWEIVNGKVTNLTFSDSSYSMYEQTGE